MNTGWWTASVSNSKVSGHFKGFDPLQRCFLSLFLLPAPLWVTATGETKTSWMENFLIDRNDSLVSFNPPVFPLKPVRPVRSQCGSVCSQPASLSLLCTTNNWFLRARFQTCCLRLKSAETGRKFFISRSHWRAESEIQNNCVFSVHVLTFEPSQTLHMWF